jgi:hypothetical protein
MLVQPPPPPPAPPPVAVAAAPARSTALASDDLVLDAPEPEPEVAPVEPVKVRKRGTPVGDWDCSGELPMPAITKIMRENQSQIRNCYERRLKANNVLQGDLSLKVKVGATGSVVASGVSGTLRDSEVFSCVRSIADKWQFPAPAGGSCAVVQVPFRFSPKN